MSDIFERNPLKIAAGASILAGLGIALTQAARYHMLRDGVRDYSDWIWNWNGEEWGPVGWAVAFISLCIVASAVTTPRAKS